MAAQADPLALALEPGNAEGTVQVSLTNTGTTALSVLRWDTPFEAILSSDVFQVERSRKGWPLVERAAYIGREVKRAAPGEDQYLVLEPGMTISQSVELNDYYRIDKADSRRVRFAGPIHYSELGSSSQASTVRKTLSTSTLSRSVLESNSVLVNVFPQLSLRVVTPAYSNCSVQEQVDIVAAARLAQDYVTTGIADLQSIAVSERSGSPRYTTWFGVYSEARFNRVLSNYVAIGDALENEQIKFDCGCDESGVYAYVYPSRPYDIVLCPAFRSSSLGGTDSRAGTIVHELSHFTILADTDDHVYSQRGAQSLASTDPDKAITNADSHEYFAENSPALDILKTIAVTPVQALALDTPVSGSVALDSSVTYQVSGASQITLSSRSGDADLYLYTDSELTAESCSSTSRSASDVCENFAEDTVYVKVFGYTSASYTLEATAVDTSAEPVLTFVPLTPNLGVSGALEEGERHVYEVSGAELITLESLTGDSDLYVFDSQEFIDSALICASAVSSDESTTDSCILPAVADTYYVLVAGNTASDYSLIATLNSDEPDDEPETIDMGRLIAGETNSESIASGQYHRFVVSGASSIELVSLTGDADLRVYATADYEESGLFCVSSQNSAVSVVETCDTPTSADQYITIFGYEESTYTLVAAPVPEEDDPTSGEPVTDSPGTEDPETPRVSDDSPVPVATSVAPFGSSGGGSINFLGLGMLILTVAYRRTVARNS